MQVCFRAKLLPSPLPCYSEVLLCSSNTADKYTSIPNTKIILLQKAVRASRAWLMLCVQKRKAEHSSKVSPAVQSPVLVGLFFDVSICGIAMLFFSNTGDTVRLLEVQRQLKRLQSQPSKDISSLQCKLAETEAEVIAALGDASLWEEDYKHAQQSCKN